MPDSKVVNVIRSQKQKLLAREAAQMRAMANRWLGVEKALDAEMIALAAQMSAVENVTEAMILREKRFTKLMFQARAEVAKYADYADGLITKNQAVLAAQGINDASIVLKLIIKDARLGMKFDRLPVDALNSLFGFAGDGTPLRNMLMRAHPDAVDGLLNALVKGLALGKNPTEVAKMMADGFGIGLQKALTLARTEQLRAYRAGNLEQYRNSGVVTGYKRMATRDSNTCPGCLFADGQMFDTEHEFDEHPNGRCQIVPVVRGAEEPTWQNGTDWFKAQSAETQREILGGERFDAWQNGASLESMSKLVNDPTWGGSFVPTPISEL